MKIKGDFQINKIKSIFVRPSIIDFKYNHIKMESIKQEFILDIHNYEIVEKLREGGFATVYIAKEKSTDNIYAAKVINAKGKKMADDKMIMREIEILSEIQGPGIVPFRGISTTNFDSEEYPTIFTKYMKNGSLGEIIRQEKINKSPVDWNNTAKMINIYGICVAMSFLHKNNIIHKDLKPDNVLLDEKYYPYISDFGMAIFMNGKTNTKTPNGGTPIFMAPEIYMNNPYTSKVDVYAFGMLLYQLISKKEPFGEFRRNTFMLWHKILSDSRPEFTDDFPESFKVLIQKCWSGKPENRPSFDEIIQMIDARQVFLPDVDNDEFEKYKIVIEQSKVKQ